MINEEYTKQLIVSPRNVLFLVHVELENVLGAAVHLLVGVTVDGGGGVPGNPRRSRRRGGGC